MQIKSLQKINYELTQEIKTVKQNYNYKDSIEIINEEQPSFEREKQNWE